MEESGLGVLLRYMNGGASGSANQASHSSPSPVGFEGWAALRTVAELAFINSPSTSRSSHPLLRVAASCGFLRSQDAFVGASYPLLYACSDLDGPRSRPATQQRTTNAPPGAANRPTLSPQSEQRRTLVEDFVARVVHNASLPPAAGGDSPSRYPCLDALERAVVEQQRIGLSPPPHAGVSLGASRQSSAPPGQQPPVAFSAAPAHSVVSPSAPPSPSTSEGTQIPKYPSLAVLASSAPQREQYGVVHAFCEVFTHTTVNAFEAETLDDDDDAIALGEAPKDLPVRNTAFLFTKPHAFARGVQQLVEQRIKSAGLRVDRCGVISTSRVDSEGIVDRHYAAIARYASVWTADRISLPIAAKQQFYTTFGVSWDDMIAAKKILNASEAAKKYGAPSGAAFASIWNRFPKRTKLAPGLYVGHFEDDDIFVVNGFYLANREKFTTPGGFINWYVVSWDPAVMSWKSFRGDFIGSTNPADAPVGSLRRSILDNWEGLGLTAAPTVSDNGVHASAGPLEGLAERLIWLPNQTFAKDVLGRTLIATNVAPAFVSQLLENPEVQIRGKKGLIFDLLEDWQTSDAIAALSELQQHTIREPNANGVSHLSAIDVLRSSATPAEKHLAIAVNQRVEPATSTKTASATGFAPHVGALPMPPTHVRPRPPPRAISSPYAYQKRSCGSGLEFVFTSTLRMVSSKSFAHSAAASALAAAVPPVEFVKRAFFGLRALQAAASDIKSTTVPDPLLSLVTTEWNPATSYAELRGAAVPAPPANRVPAGSLSSRRPPLGAVSGSVTHRSADIGDTGDRRVNFATQARLTTADRIKRRTAKLQEEIAELDRRREERTRSHLHHGVRLPAPPGPREVWGSPRKAEAVPTAISPRLPKNARPTDPSGAHLPLLGLKPEQVKLVSVSSSRKS